MGPIKSFGLLFGPTPLPHSGAPEIGAYPDCPSGYVLILELMHIYSRWHNWPMLSLATDC